MLRRLSLRDFVIVRALDIGFDSGFSVLTGETGAGKSILVDALQLALGSRGDAGVVREGAARAEIGAEFDAPVSLDDWLADAGFEPAADDDAGRLLLRRTIDAQGKSRAWINGSAATIGQLRVAADHLVDIHGQHAWQGLTRPATVRALLDAHAGVDGPALSAAYDLWKHAAEALAMAETQQSGLASEHERLTWQIGEIDKLAPAAGEWAELEAEHRRLANAQALIEAAQAARDALDEADVNAVLLTGQALAAIEAVAAFDTRLAETAAVLQAAQAQLTDAVHTLAGYLHRTEPEPQRLGEVEERLAAWLALARRYRRAPDDLPALLEQWRAESLALTAAADVDGLRQAVVLTRTAYDRQAALVSAARTAGAPELARAVTQTMQALGMAGGRFEVALTTLDAPQSFGAETVEFRVAAHAGSTPRALAKVASGGELSRIALAIAVTTTKRTGQQTTQRAAHPTAGRNRQPPALQTGPHAEPVPVAASDGDADAGVATLIFDEIDAGVGGAVAETVGRLMKRLGRDLQVLAVTHLPQVAACADHHYVVSKRSEAGSTFSAIDAAIGEARVAEVARMLGGERLSATRLAHAQEMLAVGGEGESPAAASPSLRRPAANDGEPSR